jgi:hypothetical protein
VKAASILYVVPARGILYVATWAYMSDQGVLVLAIVGGHGPSMVLLRPHDQLGLASPPVETARKPDFGPTIDTDVTAAGAALVAAVVAAVAVAAVGAPA